MSSAFSKDTELDWLSFVHCHCDRAVTLKAERELKQERIKTEL